LRQNSFLLYKQLYDASGKSVEGAYEDSNADGIMQMINMYTKSDPSFLVLRLH
jgi:iron complex outermembrane receptor protein